MKRPLRFNAVVPDDKKKSIAWILPAMAYRMLCLVFVFFLQHGGLSILKEMLGSSLYQALVERRLRRSHLPNKSPQLRSKNLLLKHLALPALIKEVAPGAEVWSLRDASTRLRAGLNKLTTLLASSKCARCACDKQPLCLLVADAGQFYEEVSSSTACRCFFETVMTAANRGWCFVAASRRKKRRFRLEGQWPLCLCFRLSVQL